MKTSLFYIMILVATANAGLATRTAPVSLPSSVFSIGRNHPLTTTEVIQPTSTKWREMDRGPGPMAALWRTMRPGIEPFLNVVMPDGVVSGRLRGFTGPNLNTPVISVGDELFGMEPTELGQARRIAMTGDVDFFDGGRPRRTPEGGVVIFYGPSIQEPFRDLKELLGFTVGITYHDSDTPINDLAKPRKNAHGQLVDLRLKNTLSVRSNGVATHINSDTHEIDSVSVGAIHWTSESNVFSLLEVNNHIPPGTPVEVVLKNGTTAHGIFRGVYHDNEEIYVILEVLDGTLLRGYNEVESVRTKGFKPELIGQFFAVGALYERTQTKSL